MGDMSNKSPTPTEAELIAKAEAIGDQIAALAARRIVGTKRIVELEKAGSEAATPPPEEQKLHDRLTELLGSAAPKFPTHELSDLVLDRAAIDRAFPILHARFSIANGAVVDARVAAQAGAWRELVRKRVFAVLALRRLNDEVDAFIASLAFNGSVPTLPAQRPALKLLGGTKSNTGTAVAALEFIEAAVREGFVTQKEIDKNG